MKRPFLSVLAGVMLLVVSLPGCCPKVLPTSVSDSVATRIEYVRHDSTIYLTDSAGIRAFLECDSAGRVKLREVVQYYEGRYIEPKVVIKENVLTVTAVIDSGAVAFSWLEKNTDVIRVRTVTQTVEKKYVPGFVKFLAWAGGVLLLCIVGYVIIRIFGKKFGL